jgi:hypothetical protein
VTVTNPTSKAVFVTTPNGCLVAFEVTDPIGIIARGGWICLTLPRRHRLEPGDIVAAFTWWIGRSILKEDITPGVYEVRGGLDFGGELTQPSPAVPLSIFPP